MRALTACLCALAAAPAAFAATAAEWRNRTIYQLLTDRFANPSSNSQCENLSDYCGGTFQGIIQHLDYIQSMGFDAIWISPPIANSPGGYHGYWQTDMYAINENFGTAQDLLDLSAALHARGMWLMLDVVGNHMAPLSDPSSFNPFNQWSHFHDCGGCPSGCNVNDYTNQPQMEHCRLAGLLDLNQSNPWVAQQLLTWITNLTSTYAVDGLRLDTTPYVWPWFWTQFSQAAGMYIVGEVEMTNVSWVASYQREGALPATLSYPAFFTLRNVFAYGNSMFQLQQLWQDYQANFVDLSVLGNFIDNHDNVRFLNEKNDPVAYKNAITWVLLSEGIPIVYYGTEASFSGGGDPACREALWPTGFNDNTSGLGSFITTLTGFRKQVQLWDAGAQVQRYADDTFYAFTRGNTFVALTNAGQGGQTQSRTITYHPYPNGQKLCNLFNPSDCVVVEGGAFNVQLVSGAPKVYDPFVTQASDTFPG